MERVFVTYDLKKGSDPEAYRKFSQNLDQVITAHRPGVLRFEVHVVKGAAAGVEGELLDRPPFEVIETIDVANWDAWMKAVASEEMGVVREAFGEVVDVSSVRQIWGTSV